MRAVVDTSVWVSAAINPDGFPAQVAAAFREERFTLVTSEAMLAEVAKILVRPRIRRRTRLTPEEEAEIVDTMRDLAELVTVTGEVKMCRDPKDDMVIETALRGEAELLVSRDEDMTRSWEVIEPLERAGVRVLTVSRFLGLLESEEE